MMIYFLQIFPNIIISTTTLEEEDSGQGYTTKLITNESYEVQKC